MSLLLDALKKAAEQKAKLAERADENSRDSDDTAMLEQTETYIAEPDDPTEIFQEDPTIALQEDATEAFEEDPTIALQEDATEAFEEDPTEAFQEDSTVGFQEDETEVSKVDETLIFAEAEAQASEEATDINIIDTGDDTVLPSFDEDETISLLSNEDVSEFLGKFNAPGPGPDQPGSDDTTALKAADDEMALRLVDDSDDTTVKAPDDAETTLIADLELVDFTDRPDEQTSTVTASSETTVRGVELESLTNERTVLRDATSTHTYAPDNYDRTLIKSTSEDATRIFAGMKSEEDVLMTPDYAKRVFLSKSSANRLQHFKIYAGIAASILLSIAIFSMFELTSEYDRIDIALMPLKRDPMPGVISSQKTETNIKLFEKPAAKSVDNQTLQIIQSANLEPTEIVDETVAEDEASDLELNETAAEVEVVEEPVSDSAVVANSASETAASSQEPLTVASVSKPAKVDSQISKAEPETGQNLKIISSTEYTDKDLWLKEAYQAYQRGDDETALQKYNQVLELDADNRNALLARAAIAVQNGDSRSAIEDYQSILLRNPKDSLAMSSLIAVANITPEKSESQLKLMIREEPDSPYLNFALANIYGGQNRWQEAQGLYFKALERNPDDPNYAYNLAVSLEHISKPKVAIPYYERALANINNGLATFNKDVVDSRLEMLRRL